MLCAFVCVSLGLKKPGDFTVSEGHGYPLVLILLSVCDGARVRHRRPTGLGPALLDSRISTDWAHCGGCRARSVIKGRPALWSPARVERARPFSGSQHGRCEHNRSLVPSTRGAWPGGRALRYYKRKKRRRRTARKEEEEDRGENRRREEKRRAWPGGGALRCCRREKRRRRIEERREEAKRREERSWLELIKIRISFFMLWLSRVFKQEVMFLVFSRWHCWGNQIVKQKPSEGGGGGVEARNFTVSEGHRHPLVWNYFLQNWLSHTSYAKIHVILLKCDNAIENIQLLMSWRVFFFFGLKICIKCEKIYDFIYHFFFGGGQKSH